MNRTVVSMKLLITLFLLLAHPGYAALLECVRYVANTAYNTTSFRYYANAIPAYSIVGAVNGVPDERVKIEFRELAAGVYIDLGGRYGVFNVSPNKTNISYLTYAGPGGGFSGQHDGLYFEARLAPGSEFIAGGRVHGMLQPPPGSSVAPVNINLSIPVAEVVASWDVPENIAFSIIGPGELTSTYRLPAPAGAAGVLRRISGEPEGLTVVFDGIAGPDSFERSDGQETSVFLRAATDATPGEYSWTYEATLNCP